jgi:hypothetical protein
MEPIQQQLFEVRSIPLDPDLVIGRIVDLPPQREEDEEEE